MKLPKFDFKNRLANLEIIGTLYSSFTFGLISALLLKLKGINLTVSVIGIFMVFQRAVGLIQPLIYTSKIKTSTIFLLTIAVDILWSFNIFLYVCNNYSVITFLIINFIICLFCEVGFCATGFAIKKFIADKIDIQEFEMWEYTYMNASTLISTSIASGLILYTGEKPLLLFCALFNIGYQFIALQKRKEIQKIEKYL